MLIASEDESKEKLCEVFTVIHFRDSIIKMIQIIIDWI